MVAEYLASWFVVPKFRDHCRYCGKRIEATTDSAGKRALSMHVWRCAREKGVCSEST